MATDSTDRSPFDDVRDAFASLGTSEKAAFVFEATFETLGQALAETGRRAASALDDLDIDDWFTMEVDVDIDAEDVDEAPPEPTPAATKAAPKTTAPKKAAPKRKTTRKPPAAKKTAGKTAPKRTPRKKKDDEG